MPNIDSLKEVTEFDKGHILTSIRTLDRQIEQILEETRNTVVPDNYKDILNVVLCGMGGSALGARIIKGLTVGTSRIPFEIYNDYTIPYYVGQKTLVILSSYSGNTEETIESAHHATEVGAKIIGITTGGKLADFLNERNLPGIIFDPKENSSGQPRMGLGYSIAAVAHILHKTNVVTFPDDFLNKGIKTVQKYINEFDVKTPESRNIAKSLAKKFEKKAPIIFASEHLYGPSYAFKNMLNETSKAFSSIFELPEANHHLLEGLSYPDNLKEVFHFMFIESDNYREQIRKRYPLTLEVIEKIGHKVTVYKPESKTKIEEIFEILVLGSYISFYLALLHNEDPSKIPWVDYFKEKLGK